MMDPSTLPPSPPSPPDDTPGMECEGGKTPRSRRQSKKKDKRAAEKAAAAAQHEFVRQLTSLQLPHMPNMSMDAMDQLMENVNNGRVEPPTLRILVVADIDLASASALAESALAASEQEQGDSSGGAHSNGIRDSNNSINFGSGGERRNSAGGGRRGDDKPENLLNRVDLCIACGPFCREEDLRQYYQGRQRRRHFQRTSAYASPASLGGAYAHNQSRAARSSMYPPSGFGHGGAARNSYNNSASHNHYSNQQHHHSHPAANHIHHQQHPFRRTREETAALEGLMTAALSQLESIVCRVVFVPGRSDPVSTITSSSSGSNNNHNSSSSMFNGTNPASSGNNSNSYYNQLFYTKERRLTPNSRNIHRHWMPLSPGLGCGGLLYMDWQKLQQPPPLEDDDDDDDDDSSSRSSILEESSTTFHDDGGNPVPYPPGGGGGGGSDDIPDDMPPMADHSETTTQHYSERAQQYGAEFCKTLERLVQLAPPTSAVTDTPTNSQITNLLKTSLFQTILVSNFHHLEPDEDEEITMCDQGDMSASNFNQSGNNFHNDHDNSFNQQNAAASADHSEESSSRQQRDDDNQSASEAATAVYGEEESDEEEEESFDPPWPTEHEAFCALPHVQEHVILEIASGLNSSGATVKPMEVPKGKVRVVLPGSLRERGEFCLVDVAFMKDPYQPRTNDYRWRVRKTRFQTINEFL